MKNNRQLSIVIPVYNEEKEMANLFDKLAIFDRSGVEVIFVDGGSQDATVSIIKSSPYQVISTEKGRGHQLHTGAQAARYDRLLFLHADSYFKESPLPSIHDILDHHPMGACRIHFQSSSVMMKLIQWGSNWRVKHRGIAFGDQAMFMTKTFYQKIGGFRPLPLMEDYDFSLRVKEAGYKIYLSDIDIFASTRRFDENGSFKMLWVMQRCQAMFRQGEDIEKIQDVYYRA